MSPDFIRACCAFVRAQINRNSETAGLVADWLGGLNEKVFLPRKYIQRPSMGKETSDRVMLRPIGKGTAVEAMKGLLWLIRSAGYAGLVLCIDEIEELAKLGTRKRQDQALQALREYVDHAGGDGGYRNLCMYLAATPEMFEGEEFFPRYDALATRIQAVGTEVNWRAPIIDLDRTPLDDGQLREVAFRICEVYRIAYGGSADNALSKANADIIASTVSQSRFRIAKPRLLARVIVDLLERRRMDQSGPPTDMKALVEKAAANIAREAAE